MFSLCSLGDTECVYKSLFSSIRSFRFFGNWSGESSFHENRTAWYWLGSNDLIWRDKQNETVAAKCFSDHSWAARSSNSRESRFLIFFSSICCPSVHKKKKKNLKYVFLHAYLWHLQKSERSVWKQTAWVLGPGCSRSGLCPRNGFLHKTNDFNTFQEKNRKKTPKCVLKKSSRRLPCFPFIGKS